MPVSLNDVASDRDKYLDQRVPEDLPPNSDEYLRRTCPPTTFEDFVEHHLTPNRPIIFPKDLCQEWSIRQVLKQSTVDFDSATKCACIDQHAIDLDKFCSRFGPDTEVPVSYCGLPWDLEAKLPCSMLLKEYVNYLAYCRHMHSLYGNTITEAGEVDPDNVFTIPARKLSPKSSSLSDESDHRHIVYGLGHRIYLKDWHLLADVERIQSKAFQIPPGMCKFIPAAY